MIFTSNNKYYDPFEAIKKVKTSSVGKKLFDGNDVSSTTYFLVRKDNNQTINIASSPFVIGSKNGVCDYVVSDNKYVGRNHAQIIIENSNCFFVDNNSTNKSYVNGKQVPPMKNVQINSGDEIRLANLSFIFNKK